MDDPSLPLSHPSELLTATVSAEGELVHRNEAWDRVFDADDEPWDQLDEDDRSFVEDYLDQARRGSLVTNQVFMVARPAAEEDLPVLLNFIPVHLPVPDEGPSVRGVLLTGEVLSEPESWMSSQTQQRRLEAIGRMAMGVTHDFNNLLSSILGYVELLQALVEDEAEPSPKDVLQYLDTIEKAASDGASLIDKIQQFIRQEKQEHFEPVDVPELLEDCIALTRPYWYNEPRRQGIAIELETDLEPAPTISGSESALREVFVNLILNAVQALPDGGTITLESRFEPDRGVVAEVCDTGIGMTDHVQSRIYEPMFTTRAEEGTGMGLSVAYGIVQEHEGEIEVKSTPGEGTCFTLTFTPATDVDRERDRPEPQNSADQASVLVVDDQQMICDVVDRLLTLKGHTVRAAQTGEKALELAEIHSFDIVFTDLGLPDISGREVAQRLRDRQPSLPIVLMTGHTERSLDDPLVDRVIDKPFKIEKVEQAMKELLAGASGSVDS